MEARDIMARDVVALSPDMGVDEAAEILIRYRIHGAQVVDADGRLVGIIIEADLLPQEAGPAGLPLTALLGREATPRGVGAPAQVPGTGGAGGDDAGFGARHRPHSGRSRSSERRGAHPYATRPWWTASCVLPACGLSPRAGHHGLRAAHVLPPADVRL